jgi:tetratricopeptide (TPR) repeat protein
VTEDIITQLSKIGDLRVISPASVVQYKGVKKSSREIGKELNVSTVLEGSVRQAGDHVHITAHLIDAATDEHLWAESYDEEMTQIFKIQSDVAQKIANALQAKLSPAEKERIQKKPTESIDAYAKYLEGREYYSRYHKQDNDNAIRLFKEALVSDQNYALAYAGLGDAYGQGVQKFGFPSQWVDSSISMSYKAISIDPNLTEGYKSLALGFAMKGWLHKALETLQKAIQINPNFDPAVENIGWSYWLVGRFDEAHLWMEKSRTLNPSFTYSHFAKGTVYLSLYEFDKAKQCFEKASEIQPDFTYSHVGRALMYILQNDFGRASHEAQLILSHSPDDLLGLNLSGNIALITGDGSNARKYYEKAESIAPGSDVFFLSTRHSTRLGYALLKNGESKAAAKMFAESDLRDQKGIEVGDESFAIPYDRACIAAVNGKKEDAIGWLQKASDQGWRDYRFGLMDPLLENLRDDPQFKELIEKTKTAVDQMRAEVDAREKSGK